MKIKSSLPTRRLSLVGVASVLMGGLVLNTLAGTVGATHSWGGYHWARQNNPFVLKLSSNLNSGWPSYLATTSSNWSVSTVLDTTIVPGTRMPKTCKPTAGRVEVCNAKYGNNGWLGLAQIWISGGTHITQGAVKMNDTYMTRPPYNTPEEYNHVMCQEVGHTLGLDHQDESGASLGTCMDYSSDPSSQFPNAHDYEELETIYAHLDSTTTVDASAASSLADKSDLNNRSNLGRRIYRSKTGAFEVYEKQYKDGTKLVSYLNLTQ